MGNAEKALRQLSDRKASELDIIPGENLKHGQQRLQQTLDNYITTLWCKGKIFSDWQNASMIPIFKKGDRADCGNHRGISLLSLLEGLSPE